MAICDKINTAGQTLQSNLNARGVSCTYGKNSENKQTLKDMADLITASNLKGSNDALISISASRPYLLSGEKTDLIVKLVNGLGQPLANKSVSVSDGTSLYSGITNNQGTFTLYDVEVTDTITMFTATYGSVTDVVLVYNCIFTDYGITSKHNDNWTLTSNMQRTRNDSYTTLSSIGSSSQMAYPISSTTKFSGDITIEWENYATTYQSDYLIIKGTSDTARTFGTLGINKVCNVKITVVGTSVKSYIDGVQKDSYTINRDSNNQFQVRLQINPSGDNIKYSNFRMYSID